MGRITYLALVLLSITYATLATTPTVVNKKCTKNDPRKGLYPECMQSESLVLWCDFSSYTSVPHPNSMYQEKSCNDSIALYVNDSCLPAIHQHEIRRYPLIQELDCGKNFIKVLTGHLLRYNRKLRRVNFGQNEINTVHDRTFFGLNKLEVLNLTRNRLSSLGPQMFFGLTSLKELYIQSNNIQVLKPYTFKFMSKLEVLVLTGNKISHIDKLAFSGLKNLVRLHLDGNDLSSLDPSTFERTPKLKVLTLSFNKFKVAPSFTPNSLTNLHTLNLGHNLLRELHISRIANLSKLQNLSLENNSISVVSEDSLHHMPSLRFLNLSSNGIEEVNRCSFSKTCHLEVLSLRHNSLKTPHPEWLTALIRNDAVRGTDISGNPWKCDCKAIRFQEFLTSLPLKWNNGLAITCDWPKEHFGKNLSDVIYSLKTELKCKDEPNKETDRPCNSSISLAPIATEVYTYLPTTTDEDSLESTSNILADEPFVVPEKEAVVGSNLEVEDRPPPPNEPLNNYLLIALGATVLIVVALAIYVVRIVRRNKSKQNDKTDSEEIILPSPQNSRSDSESSCETDKTNISTQRQDSTVTVATMLSRQSFASHTEGMSKETTPFQPQGDLNSGSRISSDSGINSYPSSITSSELTLSVGSNSSIERSRLDVINENEVSNGTTIDETTPKMVINTNQDDDDDEGLVLMGQREPPVGSDANGGVC